MMVLTLLQEPRDFWFAHSSHLREYTKTHYVTLRRDNACVTINHCISKMLIKVNQYKTRFFFFLYCRPETWQQILDFTLVVFFIFLRFVSILDISALEDLYC